MVLDTACKAGVATHLLAWRWPHGGPPDGSGWRHQLLLQEVHNWTEVLVASTRASRRPASHHAGFRLEPVAGTIARLALSSQLPMRSFAAGTSLEAAALRTWATTASGRFSWRSTCRPAQIEAQSSSSCEINGQLSTVKMTDFAFPYANRVCFKFAAHGQCPATKLYWYDGGMRPSRPTSC
jgi:hypothetical protein